jgi:hypothetical protein
VIIIDENIIHDQRELLRNFKISFKQIGVDFVRKGLKDVNELIPLLHSLRRPTFFTRDVDFYKRQMTHRKYCVVYLDIRKDQVAEYIRRLLRHPEFNTQAKRMGRVVRVAQSGIHCWRINVDVEQFFDW